MKCTANVSRDTVVAILEQALEDGLLLPPNGSDENDWEPRTIPESDLNQCIAAFRRGARQFQAESSARFHADLLALLDRHGLSADVRYETARGKADRTGDVLYSTNSPITVKIEIAARDDGSE